MISIIIVGRNDNYGGDFDDRLFATTSYNLARLEERNVPVELLFIEWNPVPDQPLLSERIVETYDNARCIVVDGLVHELISLNRYIKVFEFHAKNVGALRASGDRLLLTNPDNFFGSKVFEFLAGPFFDPQMLYRAGRVDIDDRSGVDNPDLEDPAADHGPPYTRASGDFLMCAKSLFHDVGGFREDLTFTNTHKDSIFCHTVFERHGKVAKIGSTYHLKHGRVLEQKRRVEYAWWKVKRSPQKRFGLMSGCVSTHVAPRIEKLELTPRLARKARKRAVPEPVVPAALA